MNTYLYKAIKDDGSVVQDNRTAESKEALSESLTAEGLTVVFVEEKKKAGFIHKLNFSFGSVKDQEKVIFARNLGKMISAGLSVVRALEIIERQQKKGRFQKVLIELRENVSKGNTLAESMNMHSDVFSSLMVAMVRAGEESGNLAESLGIVSNQIEQALILKKKIKGAMIYPGVILFAMFIIAILMLMFVVPTLTQTFDGLDLELPLSTRSLIWASNAMQHNTVITFSAILIFIALVITFFKSRVGQRFVDFATLRIPIVKGIKRELNSARTARTLSSLLKSGVDFAAAIGITEEVLQSRYYKKALVDAQEIVVKGGNISEVFAKHSYIYPLYVAEMAAVGEETGKVADMLYEVAIFYEEEVQRKTKDMSTVIEPFLMIMIGTGVGFFALAMMSPMYSLAEHI